MVDEELTNKILQDMTLLKYVGVNPIVVHGGGPEINAAVAVQMDVKSEFHNGLRITDEATMEVVQMVLAGKINKNIVSQLGTLGGKAIGLCGKDANLISVDKKPLPKDGVDLGYRRQYHSDQRQAAGDAAPWTNTFPLSRRSAWIGTARAITSTPILPPAKSPSALKAEKLMFLTDVDGIRLNAKDSRHADFFDLGFRDQRADLLRRHHRRHDSQGAGLHPRHRARRQARPHPGRHHPASHFAGNLHRQGHRHHGSRRLSPTRGAIAMKLDEIRALDQKYYMNTFGQRQPVCV